MSKPFFKNLNGKKKVAAQAAQNKSFIEISWTDGGGTRFMWVDPDVALAFAAEVALVAAIAKREQAKKIAA